MFKIRNKKITTFTYIVYDVKVDEQGFTKFLIFRDNVWEWIGQIDKYEPI